MKRACDAALSLCGLILCAPLLGILCVLVWIQDFRSPFYIALRAGCGNRPFKLVKLRSMVVDADKSGINSTAATDGRITRVGHFIRRFKCDELMQLWNVLLGDMSLVGPRPQVVSEIPRYTQEEMRLLSVRPGITDLASIVFADEGEILKGSEDPDLRYEQVIRPWKSRLSLLCIEKASLWHDWRILWLTALCMVNRSSALKGVERMLIEWQADPLLIRMASRVEPLRPYPPPGATEIVASR
jgi:lipopolysaccharide/colanic/teichoic acid biosynthesis glycosyltransferase